MPFTFQVDVPRKNDGGIPYAEPVNDYVMLCSGHEKIYVQHGGIYLNGAEELSPAQAPAWFWEAYGRITPATRKLVGLPLAQDREQEAREQVAKLTDEFQNLPADVQAQLRALLASQAPRIDEKAPKTSIVVTGIPDNPTMLKIDPEAPALKYWVCDECGARTELRKKGVHLARHARMKKVSK